MTSKLGFVLISIKLGDGKRNFIHIFAYIMEGRSVTQKQKLSRRMIERLNEMFPAVTILSINIAEFEKETYSNRALIHPLNITSDRHFSIED
jgi:5-carboxymethyl-2-hydroxymuconate isomerase